MDNDKFIQLCKQQVVEYIFEHNIEFMEDVGNGITTNDVYVVWLNRTLQNNKALLSTTIEDGMYYEVTYNGDKDELYFDAYKHVHNEAIELGD